MKEASDFLHVDVLGAVCPQDIERVRVHFVVKADDLFLADAVDDVGIDRGDAHERHRGSGGDGENEAVDFNTHDEPFYCNGKCENELLSIPIAL